MTEARLNWTAEQRLAIEASGRDVLVTASAGTGKTAVLTQRCVRILTDASGGTDVSGILVMTFTDAAAEEMRCRIAAELRRRYAATRDARLKHQLLMIDAADISTIHAFCKRLITEHFYLIGIDPAFRILEPDEQFLLRSDVLQQVVEDAWTDTSLAQGLAALLNWRNLGGGNMGFLKNVMAVSGFLDSLPSRTTFYERARALAEVVSGLSEELAGEQRKVMARKLEECRSQLRYAQLLDRKLAGGHWCDQIESAFLGPVELCIGLLREGKFAACAEIVLNHQKPKFITRPRELAAETADLIKAPAKRAMDTFAGLRDLAVVNPDYCEMVGAASSLQTKVMVELVQRFDRRYAEAKRRANCLDFADLEHLALRLLDENADVTAKLRRRFRHIFVDEYQDINALQQAIIDRISSGDNVFAVGDIKQSIYGFRQSRPEIFLERLARASDAPVSDGQALRVDLGHNFRSRRGILEFANALFGRIMKSSVAAIDYDKRAALTCGLEYRDAASGQSAVEMVILDEDADSDASAESIEHVISAAQRQAAFIASRIQRMVGANGGSAEFEVYDRAADAYRPVQYGDIVILMRGLAHTAKEYVEILRLGGVPVNSQSCAGYFAATEISDCLCLLKVLDNPQQDIEFAAVLRSPFFGVGESELAEVCAHAGRGGRDISFCGRVRKYVEDGADEALGRRLGGVLEQLDRWRAVAARQGLAELLRAVYAETDYAAFVSALPNGRQRKANLYKLHDRAIQFAGFAASRRTSLSRFVEYIEKLLDRGEDWAPAAPETSAENAVRLMSIHKSKGLEFPVVFLAETNRRFNLSDMSGDCLAEDRETIGLRIIEPHLRVKLDSIAHQVICDKKMSMNLAEEMRLLYVAVTRARERLIITASRTASQCRGILTHCAVMDGEAPADWQIRSARCHFDWLLYAFGGHRRLLRLFDMEGGDGEMDSDLYTAEAIDRGRLDRLSAAIMAKRENVFKGSPASVHGGSTAKTAELLERVAASVDWKYPWQDVTGIAAKQSVSELTHRDDEFAAMDLTAAFGRLPAALSCGRSGRKTGPDARTRGTAAHMILEHLDLSAAITAESIRQAAARLAAAGKMPADVAAAVQPEPIEEFFGSDLGRLVLDNAGSVRREWPFTMALDARKLGAACMGESVIVQGIIDVLIETSAGPVIIDFKTDSIDEAGVERRAELYKTQLRYYAQATQAVLGRRAVAAWLYFLSCGRAVEIAAD